MVVGGLLISLLWHSDRVAVACLAQLVNVMAPIRAERGVAAWRQPSFVPFALTARHCRGDVLRVEATSSAPAESSTRGDLEPIDLIATHDAADGSVTLAAVNRSVTDNIELEARVAGGERLRVVEHALLGGHEGGASTNTAEHPDRAGAESSSRHAMDRGRLRVLLPPASWTMIRVAP